LYSTSSDTWVTVRLIEKFARSYLSHAHLKKI